MILLFTSVFVHFADSSAFSQTVFHDIEGQLNRIHGSVKEDDKRAWLHLN